MTALSPVLTPKPALAASPFVEQLHKAQARDADDRERIEFATRALRAWEPPDGRPLLAAAHFARAEGEMEKMEHALADEDLNKALEIDPGNDKAALLRARARLGLGRGADAEADALLYLDSRREDGEAWLVLGDARLLKKGEEANAAAREAFRKAAGLLGPGDPRPSLGEGRAFLAKRRHRDALAALTAAAERPAKWRGDILRERSKAYSALGDWGAAQGDLTRAIPELERRLDDLRRRDVAPRAYDAARGELADCYFRRGLAHEALSDRKTALLDYRSACDLGSAAGCARAAALEKPRPQDPPKPKPAKKKRKANPKGEAGERIYAN